MPFLESSQKLHWISPPSPPIISPLPLHPHLLPAILAESETSSEASMTVWKCYQVEECT